MLMVQCWLKFEFLALRHLIWSAVLTGLILLPASTVYAGGDWSSLSPEGAQEVLGNICPGEVEIIAREFGEESEQVVRCTTCPAFTSGDRDESWTLLRGIAGSFSSGDAEELLLFMSGCESGVHEEMGGAVILRRTSGGWRAIDYWPHLHSRGCATIEGPQGRDRAVCRYVVSDNDNRGDLVTLVPGSPATRIMSHFRGLSVDGERNLKSQFVDRLEAVSSDEAQELHVHLTRETGVLPEGYETWGGIGYRQAIEDGHEFEEEKVIKRIGFVGDQIRELDDETAEQDRDKPTSHSLEIDDIMPAEMDSISDISPIFTEICGEEHVTSGQSESFDGPIPVCSRCPDMTSGGDQWEPVAVWTGTYLPNELTLIVAMNGCEPHAYGFGGTLVIRSSSEDDTRINYEREVDVSNCKASVMVDGIPHLFCATTHVGQGAARTSYYLTRPVGGVLVTEQLTDVHDNEGACAYRGEFKSEVEDFAYEDFTGDGVEEFAFQVEVQSVEADNRPDGGDPCSKEGLEIGTRTEYRVVSLHASGTETKTLSIDEFRRLAMRAEAESSEPKALRWEFDDDQSDEAPDRSSVDEFLEQHRDSIQECYSPTDESVSVPSATSVRLLIFPDGSIVAAYIGDLSPETSPVEECLTRTLRGLEFPSPPREDRVSVTVEFLYGGDDDLD